MLGVGCAQICDMVVCVSVFRFHESTGLCHVSNDYFDQQYLDVLIQFVTTHFHHMAQFVLDSRCPSDQITTPRAGGALDGRLVWPEPSVHVLPVAELPASAMACSVCQVAKQHEREAGRIPIIMFGEG